MVGFAKIRFKVVASLQQKYKNWSQQPSNLLNMNFWNRKNQPILSPAEPTQQITPLLSMPFQSPFHQAARKIFRCSHGKDRDADGALGTARWWMSCNVSDVNEMILLSVAYG